MFLDLTDFSGKSAGNSGNLMLPLFEKSAGNLGNLRKKLFWASFLAIFSQKTQILLLFEILRNFDHLM